MVPPSNKRFVKRLNELLAMRNMRPSDLARKMGVSRAQVNNLLHRNQEVTLGTVDRVADALGVSARDLLIAEGGEGVSVEEAKVVLRKHFRGALKSKAGRKVAADLSELLLAHLGEE